MKTAKITEVMHIVMLQNHDKDFGYFLRRFLSMLISNVTLSGFGNANYIAILLY